MVPQLYSLQRLPRVGDSANEENNAGRTSIAFSERVGSHTTMFSVVRRICCFLCGSESDLRMQFPTNQSGTHSFLCPLFQGLHGYWAMGQDDFCWILQMCRPFQPNVTWVLLPAVKRCLSCLSR